MIYDIGRSASLILFLYKRKKKKKVDVTDMWRKISAAAKQGAGQGRTPDREFTDGNGKTGISLRYVNNISSDMQSLQQRLVVINAQM